MDPKSMIMSLSGLHTLETREGIRLRAYQDSVGVWTIGVGHTGYVDGKPVQRGMTITQAKCDEIFQKDVDKYGQTVRDCVKVPLTQNQFDALTSFCFNIGQAGFARSGVVAALNKKDYKGAANAMMQWVRPAVLKGRRTGEMKQFLTPDRVQTPTAPAVQPVVPVVATTPKVGNNTVVTPLTTTKPTLTTWQRMKEWIF